MNSKAAVLLTIAGLALASCAGDDAVVTTEWGAGAPPPAAGQIWQVRRVTCREWLARPEPERHSAAVFFYGWLAGRQRTQTIDMRKMVGDLQRVMDRCTRNPELALADAYQETLTRPARWIWEQP